MTRLPWINFVVSKCKDESSSIVKHENAGPVSGDEASQFYEYLISQPSADRTDSSVKKRTCGSRLTHPSKKLKVKRKPEDIFKCAERGDVLGVKECLSQGVEVNLTDAHGWTPLMCAACAGHEELVKLLVRSGGSIHHKDKAGNDARKVAMKQKHINLIQIFDTFNIEQKSAHKAASPKNEVVLESSSEGYMCKECEVLVQDSKSKHECSITHILNSKVRKCDKPVFQLPESNIGYQIMRKCGWNGTKGLGPSESGKKYPVKTILKRDRLGLGTGEKRQARVTHFRPFDQRAVQPRVPKPCSVTKELTKREKLAAERKSRQFEIHFRREFH